MKKLLLLTGFLVACSGCETLIGQQSRLTETRINSQVANLNVEIQRLDQRVAGLEADREILHTQVAELQREWSTSESRRNAELAAIDAQLKAQTQEQLQVRRDLADELSGKIATIMKSQAVSSKATRTQAGYEHVVKAGQTLSEIAREYKVSSEAIVKANNMKNPNDLRVGQKLFIPE